MQKFRQMFSWTDELHRKFLSSNELHCVKDDYRRKPAPRIARLRCSSRERLEVLSFETMSAYVCMAATLLHCRGC
jgi:hypothetical protein